MRASQINEELSENTQRTGGRILIAEDEGVVALDLQRRLERLGYAVVGIYDSGDETMEAAGRLVPDLVLMDIKLRGDMDGTEAAGQIRDRFGIPVVYLTSYADDVTLKLAKAAEPYGYIVKPFRDAELRSTVDVALFRHKAEEALRESKEKYRVIFEQAADSIVLIDTETGAFVEFNNRAHENLGYTRDEFQELKVADLDIIESAEDIVKHAEKIINKGSDVFETKMRTKNGAVREVLVNAKSVLIRGKKHVLSIWHDITERKSMEEELQNSHNLLEQRVEERTSELKASNERLLAEVDERKRLTEALREREKKLLKAQQVAGMGFLDWNLKTNDMYWSEEIYRIYGVKPPKKSSELLDITMKLVHPDDQEFVQKNLDMAVKGIKRYDIDHRKLLPDGKVIWVHAQADLTRDQDGNPESLIGTIVDITERKKAEEALRQMSNEQEVILDSVPAMIFYKDKENRFLRVNKALADIFGLPKEVIIGKTASEISPAEKDYWKDDQEVIKSGQPKYNIIEPVETSEGTLWFQTDKIPYKDSEGNTIGVIGFSIDITERKKAKETLKKSQGLLAETERMGKVGGWEFNIDTGKQIWTEGTYNIHELDLTYEPTVEKGVNFYTPASRPIIERAVQRAIEHGEPFDVELEILTAKGNLRSVQTIGKTDFEHHRVYGFFQDITERKHAEEALLETEKRFHTSVENMLDCFGIYSAIRDESGHIVDFRIDYVNAAACATNLMTKNEQIGKRLCELLPAHRETGLFDEYCQVVETGKPIEKESLIYGEVYEEKHLIRAFDIRAVKLGDGFTAAWRDVTKRKQIEDNLRESEEHYRMLTETMNDGLGQVDENGRYVYVNNKFGEMLGYSPDEMVGRHWTAFFDENAQKITNEQLLQRRKGSSEAYELINTRRDGQKIFIHISPQGIFDADGKFMGSFAIMTDITEHKQAEESLQENEERYRSLFENMLNGLAYCKIIVDEKNKPIDFVYLEVNYSFERITGLKRKDVIGEKVTEAIPSIKKTHPELFDIYGKVALTGKGDTFDICFKPLDIWLSISVYSPQKGYFVAIFEDITERKLLEEQMLKHQAELLHVSRLSTIGEMASGLSHELNQPLCAAINYTNACLHSIRSGNAEMGTLIENIEAAAAQTKRAGDIVNSIKNFVKKRKSHRTTVDINEMIRRFSDFLASDIHRNEVSLNLELDKQIPMVLADVIQIEQVLLNLVLNAIEAMTDVATEQRRLTIRTKSADGAIEVDVRDSGKGMSEDVSRQAFDSFFTTKPDGLGIGLSISRSIIEAHQGGLWAKKNPDCGTTFTFSLPVT